MEEVKEETTEKAEEPKVEDKKSQVIETFATPDDWNTIKNYLKLPIDSIYSMDVTDVIAFTALKLASLEEECQKLKKSLNKK